MCRSINCQRRRLLCGTAIRDDDRLRQIKIAELGNGKIGPLDRLCFDRIFPIHDLPQEAASLLAGGLNGPRRPVPADRRPALPPVWETVLEKVIFPGGAAAADAKTGYICVPNPALIAVGLESVDRAFGQFQPEHASPDRFSDASVWLPYGYQLVARSGLFERT
jgi:hypothetical protein